MLRAVFLYGNIPGYHLLITAGHIPAEFHGSQSVLPPIQIFSFCSGKEGYAAHAKLAHGIHTGTVDRRRAAGAQHHMGAPNQHPFLLRSVQAEQALYAFFADNDAAGHGMIRNRNMPCPNTLLQCFGHVAAGQRSCTGGTATKVVIRLIAHIFPVIIHGKRHTQGSQLQKALRRACRLAQGKISVHIIVLQGLRHQAYTVFFIPRQGKLIVGLLIAASVPAGAAEHVFRYQQHILPQGGKPIGCVQSGTA